MGKGQKVYMPVVVGDWLKGTRGMRADARGVYLGLLLHQWEKGFIPEDVYELEEIEREVNKVWDKLKEKFVRIAPGKLQNEHLEEIREFWAKQKKNGGKGGRPKKEKPELNPDSNPKENPKSNHHNAPDLDHEYELKNKKEPDFQKPDIDGDEIVFPIDTPLMRDLWAGWKKYRYREHSARYGIMGEQADLKRMQGKSFAQIEETILAAIGGKWKNLYPEKNGRTTQNSIDKKQQQSAANADYLKDYYAAKTSSHPPG